MASKQFGTGTPERLAGPYADLIGLITRDGEAVELDAAHGDGRARVSPLRDDAVRVEIWRGDGWATATVLPTPMPEDAARLGCHYAALRMLGGGPAREPQDLAGRVAAARQRAEEAASWQPRQGGSPAVAVWRRALIKALDGILPSLQVVVASRVGPALAAVAPDIIDRVAIVSAASTQHPAQVRRMLLRLAPARELEIVTATWVIAVNIRQAEAVLNIPREPAAHRTLPASLWLPVTRGSE